MGGCRPPLDICVGTLNCPFGNRHMGINRRKMSGRAMTLTRAQQDAFALAIRQEVRAAAIACGLF